MMKKLITIFTVMAIAVITASAEETTNEYNTKALEYNNDMEEYYKSRVKYHEEECKAWMEDNQERVELERRMDDFNKKDMKGAEDLATIA